MTQPRSSLVSLADTPWYHVVSRCVRRAFLCGDDLYSGQCFDHRRAWIVERVKQLAGVFAIDVAAYAVMSNHYHLVVRIDVRRAKSWSHEEILRRWTMLFDGPPIIQRYVAGDKDQLGEAGESLIHAYAETYRARLYDLSWFARVLNESIARRANAEEGVTGRFWDGRFKTQALLDEQAVLAAMTYVDLNPIRAQMADTPEASQYTSIAERIAAITSLCAPKPGGDIKPTQPRSLSLLKYLVPRLKLKGERHFASLPLHPLMPFDSTRQLPSAIPFSFEAYLQVVESTGRCIRSDKRGAIPPNTPPLLARLNIDPVGFVGCTTALLRHFGSAVGTPSRLRELCTVRKVRHLRGIAAAQALSQYKAA